MTSYATTDPGTSSRPVDVLLSDGSVAAVRPAVPDDFVGVMELQRHAVDGHGGTRFFTPSRSLAEQYAKHLVDAMDGRLAVVLERSGELLGVASAEPLMIAGEGPHDKAAEVVVFVGDRWQHLGVGTLLLEHLAAAARNAGLQQFTALVPAKDATIVEVFVYAGFNVQFGRVGEPEVLVTLDLTGTRPLAAAVTERERRATAASIAALLAPRSVVVVGASRRLEAGSVGHSMLVNLRKKNFTGRLAAVNPHVVPGEMIGGIPAYRTVAEIPWHPDLAVIAVPAGQVATVLENCGQAGVRGAVVVSAGFAEDGNRAGQEELVRIAHRHGIRMIGPNCLGVLNTDPAIRLDATFAKSTPVAGEHGGIAVAAQSGAFGISVLDAAWQRGFGISSFVSLGNKADVSANDLLLYWAGDPRTQVIAMYLESIGNPRRFRRIAAQVARTKPIVALRSGRSEAGARASHTAAAATPDAAATALFLDAGVIAAENTDELIDIAMLLADQPVPLGRRVLILGNGGGPEALAADAAAVAGATLPRLASDTVARLRVAVPTAFSLENPVNLGAAATADDYRAALDILLTSDDADSVVVVYVATAARQTHSVVEAIEVAERECRRNRAAPDVAPRPVTVAGVMIGAVPPRGGVLPWYKYAEAAARAVSRAGELGEWRALPALPLLAAETEIPVDIDRHAIEELLATATRTNEGWLAGEAAGRLLELVGVPVTAGPVTQVTGASELELSVRLNNPVSGVPILSVGAGGVHQAVSADQVLRSLPLAGGTADRMLRQLRCSALLAGDHGSPALALTTVVDLVERIAGLELIAPQIRELEVNPLVVTERTAAARSVRVRVAVPGEPPRRKDSVNDDFDRALG